MRRFLVLLFLSAAAALGLWYGMRGHSVKGSSSSVAALLPRETIAFVHLPDFNRTRAEWHQTDLYKLWREPAVQDFLQKPLSRVPNTDAARQKIQELDALEMKDAFFAITSVDDNRPTILGGFRFKGEPATVEKVFGGWRNRGAIQEPAAAREVVDYEKHRIEVTTQGTTMIATVYDGEWFFIANDVARLKALLDRADNRSTDAALTLAADENFASAFKKIPARYTVIAYGRADQVVEHLAAKLPPNQSAADQLAMLRQIKSVVGATIFENGKIRDVLFVTMPKASDPTELTRASLSLATSESFLYGASFLHLPKRMNTPASPSGASGGFPAAAQRFAGSFSALGVTTDDWNEAFGAEIGVVGDWPVNARLPALLATMPVKDAQKANDLATKATTASGEESRWSMSEQNGVHFYTQMPANPMIPVAPTIAISDKLAVLGLDRSSVTAALHRAGGSSSLAVAQSFKAAEALVPTATQSFWYIDSALLYTRLDSTLRPMLVMGAAFVPAIAQTVDLGKVPAPDVVTKHLSPIVMSQTYDKDGYRMESIGPVSLYHAILGIAGVSGMGAAFYQHQFGNVGSSRPPFAAPVPAMSVPPPPLPASTASATPADGP